MIKFNKDYSDEINRIVKNFNAKITRLENKGTPSYLIPKREKARILKRDYKSSTRRELNIRLRELQAFSRRGSERPVKLKEGGRTTNWNLGLMRKRQRRIKAQKRREIVELEKNLKPFDYQGYSKLSSLKALFKKISKSFASREDISSFNVEYLKEYSPHRKNVFYDNFFTALFKDGRFIGYDIKKLQMIEEALRKFTPDELIQLSEKSPLISGIFDYYNSEDTRALNYIYDELYANLSELKVYLS